jgi:hypothetical protein
MQDNKKENDRVDKLIITISRDDEQDELFNILLYEGKLPFKLPSHIMFPSGKKEFARRSKMLMLAGIDFLREKYPQDTGKSDEKTMGKKHENDKKELANF